jgi:hypothetical protein
VDTMTLIIFVTLSVIAVWNIVLTVLLYRINKKNNLFFDDSSKNLRELVTRAITDNKSIGHRINKVEAGNSPWLGITLSVKLAVIKASAWHSWI